MDTQMILAEASKQHMDNQMCLRSLCHLDHTRINPSKHINIVHIVDEKDFFSAPCPYITGKIKNETNPSIKSFYNFEPRIAYCLSRHYIENPFSCTIVTEKNDMGVDVVIAVISENFIYDCRNPETFPDGYSDPSVQCPRSENPHTTARLEIREKTIQTRSAEIIPFTQKCSKVTRENADKKPGPRNHDH